MARPYRADFMLVNQPDMGLAHALRACIKLHFSEMLASIGSGETKSIAASARPRALVRVKCRHMGVTEARDDIHRLPFSVAGLGIMLQIGSDVFPPILLKLIASLEAIDHCADRLVDCGLDRVASEPGGANKLPAPHIKYP